MTRWTAVALAWARAVREDRSTWRLSAWLFGRALGVTALAAIGSLHAQVLGLFGSEGVVPLAPRVERIVASLGAEAWDLRPSLLYLTGADDGALVGLCVAGEIAAVLLALGIVPGPAALACFAVYGSFVAVGSPFVPLQWDTLLCEALALGAVIAPWSEPIALPSRAREPAGLARWAVVLLAARLMLASGIVKLAADEAWRDLRALTYHYETQPLPSPVSPWMHAAPLWIHQAGALFTFLAEIAAPLFFFAPRRLRHPAVAIVIALQVAIALTGNFGFFNLLAIVLCIPAIDDAAIAKVLPARWRAPGTARVRPWQVVVPSLCAVLLMLAQLAQFATSLGAPAREEILAYVERTERWHLTSSYGLFAVMTRTRPELVIEGSTDGRTWRTYELRYKPGDPARGLPITLTHMPRLDWMLWFAALSDSAEDVPWVRGLGLALLERRAPVLALFARDPFEGEAPRYVRITRWQYWLAPPGSDVTWRRGDPEPFGQVLGRR